MVLHAHPDDEGIFFGGTIPYYTQIRNLPVVTVSMVSKEAWRPDFETRENELRNAAWVYGMRNEPIFARMPDLFPATRDSTWDIWPDGVVQGTSASVQEGRDFAAEYMATQIRMFRPEVILSHDLGGEYGHGAHQATAWSATDAFTLAADPNVVLYDDQGQELEPWQASKLYLHLYDQNQLFHSAWEIAYDELGGLTPRQVADLGLDEHVTQGSPDVSSFYRAGENFDGFDSERWGLYASSVGLDSTSTSPIGPGVHYGDFFEHTDLARFASFLADSNGDGVVGVDDLDFLLANWGNNVPIGSVASGDADGNGVIGQGDLDLLISGWGQGALPDGLVPEPGTCATLVVCSLLLNRRRRAQSGVHSSSTAVPRFVSGVRFSSTQRVPAST